MIHIHATKHNGQFRAKLSGELTIYSVRQARLELLDLLGKHPALELDLSEVEELDTAGIQLLYWLRRTATARSAQLPFVNHSPAVVDGFDLLKVTTLFGDPILIAPTAS